MGADRLAFGACVLALLGCGPTADPWRQAPVFDAPVAERVDEQVVFEHSSILRWPLESPDWRAWPEAPAPKVGHGFLTVPPRETPFQLRKDGDLDAAKFESVAVTLARPATIEWMRICFNLTEQDRRACQSIHATGAHRAGLVPFRFWPIRLPDWQGPVSEVIVIVGPATSPVRIADVSFETSRVAPASLERAWRVPLLGKPHIDERVALLAQFKEHL